MDGRSASLIPVSLVWAVPVVAAVTATLVVAMAAGPLADEVAGLRDAARGLSRLRPPLAAVRAQVAEAADLGEALRRRHAGGGDGNDGDGHDGGGAPPP